MLSPRATLGRQPYRDLTPCLQSLPERRCCSWLHRYFRPNPFGDRPERQNLPQSWPTASPPSLRDPLTFGGTRGPRTKRRRWRNLARIPRTAPTCDSMTYSLPRKFVKRPPSSEKPESSSRTRRRDGTVRVAQPLHTGDQAGAEPAPQRTQISPRDIVRIGAGRHRPRQVVAVDTQREAHVVRSGDADQVGRQRVGGTSSAPIRG